MNEMDDTNNKREQNLWFKNFCFSNELSSIVHLKRQLKPRQSNDEFAFLNQQMSKP